MTQPNLSTKAMIVFKKAQWTIDNQVADNFKANHLTSAQFGVLDVLYSRGEMKICQLIDKLMATSGNMTVVLKNMEKNGWIYRKPAPDDKRASLIGLTEEGKYRIEATLPKHLEIVEKTMSVLTPSEQETLITLLKKFKNV